MNNTMTLHIRRTVFWGILFLALLSVCSCGNKFSILDYQMTVVSVKPGTWENGIITRYPSVDVKIEGPDTQDWEIVITPDNGSAPYYGSTVTGRVRSITLEGINLSKDRREMGITIQVVHVNSGETLAVNRQYKASIEGDFDPVIPPAPQSTISVAGLSLVVDEDSSVITVAEGNKVSIDVLENYSGNLVLSYSKEESETEAVTCTLSQTDGMNHFILPKNEDIIKGESTFTIPFTTGEPGTGRFSVILKGSGPETVLSVSYVVKSRPYVATFTPNHFNFASHDAHGTVEVFGFREGEKCDVVLNWKETTTGNEGKALYSGVNAKTPLEVVLWKAGEAKMGNEFVFWAQVYEEGKAEPVAVTEEQSVSPISISWSWTDAHGNPSAAGEAIRSWASSSACRLDVMTASWAPEFIEKVTVNDVTSGRTFSTPEPAAETEGCYGIEMTHPDRGVHNFTIILETTEGEYSFETEKTFIDVWTISPWTKGSSLYVTFVGPASSIKTDCNLSITLHGYAIWDYTIAETNESGQHVNTPKQEIKLIGSRTEPFTIDKGTSSGSDIKVKPVAGLFNVAMRMLKDKCSGKPFSMTGISATRWSGSSIATYTPATSNTFVKIVMKADAPFYEDYNELETDISRLKTTLANNGIYY